MSRPKPIGFDNWKTFSFVSNDGSGFTFFRKASFSLIESSEHKLYAGPSIASTDADADCTITTDEPHGFKVGQTVVIHGMTSPASGVLDGSHVITEVPSTTTFKIGVDTTAEGATAGVGIVGVDIEARIPVANYCCVPGGLCIEDHPEAWEMPLVG
jgi:hypothetical protein